MMYSGARRGSIATRVSSISCKELFLVVVLLISEWLCLDREYVYVIGLVKNGGVDYARGPVLSRQAQKSGTTS